MTGVATVTKGVGLSDRFVSKDAHRQRSEGTRGDIRYISAFLFSHFNLRHRKYRILIGWQVSVNNCIMGTLQTWFSQKLKLMSGAKKINLQTDVKMKHYCNSKNGEFVSLN